jgi:hypothetical protein
VGVEWFFKSVKNVFKMIREKGGGCNMQYFFL